MYDDMKGVTSPPFAAEKFLANCSLFLEFAKDNLGFTVTIAKPALAVKPALAAVAAPAAASAKRDFQFCTQCGRQNAITARFCVKCGKPMKPAT
jgi:ribosomal protein L40E